MKRIFPLLLVMLWAIGVNGQNPCGQGRYISEIFAEVDVQADVEFGANLQPTAGDPNAIQTLYMDVYLPKGDTLSQRPLIIFAFGGGFILGSRKDADISTLCERFAKRGYVTASIDYRVTPELFINGSEQMLYRAIYKAVHDMKAAVRFFRKDADSANLARINPDMIFVGGISAGGVTSVHVGYLDETEFPSIIAQDSAAIGGLEGLSGNPGFPSDVAGIINLCGAIGDTTWMKNSDVPIISAHGTADNVVPYGTTTTFFGFPITVHGSASIHEEAQRIGISSELLTWQGVGHAPFTAGPNFEQYMEETITYVSQSMADFVCVEDTSGNNNTFVADELSPVNLTVYPVPAEEQLVVSWESPDRMEAVLIRDLMGRTVLEIQPDGSTRLTVERNGLPAGIYLLSLQDRRHQVVQTVKIRFQ